MVGAVLAILGLAVAGALALFRPRDVIGDAVILAGKDTAALYVVENGVVHPVTNLASARLVVGRADTPTRVAEDQLQQRPAGPLIGIIGAPSALPADSEDPLPTWTACDTMQSGSAVPAATSILLTQEPVSGDRATALGAGQGMLWSNDGRTYLVHNGVRSQVDLADRAVVRALGLDPSRVTPASSAVLESVREAPPIVAPVIPRVGEQPRYNLGGRPVGSVVEVERNDGAEYYLLLDDGVQQVPSTVAELVRFSDVRADSSITVVGPGELAAIPTTTSPVAVDAVPTRQLELLDRGDQSVHCLSWTPTSTAGAETVYADVRLLVARQVPVPDGMQLTAFAGADGAGPLIDDVYVDRPAGYFAVATGAGTSESRRDAAFVVANTGVRYGVADAESRDALGLGHATMGPWPILKLLPEGPVLARDRARVLHDGDLPDEAVRSMDGG